MERYIDKVRELTLNLDDALACGEIQEVKIKRCGGSDSSRDFDIIIVIAG